MSGGRVELAKRAVKDLAKLQPGDRKRIAEALRELVTGADNLDIKALVGVAPWLRLRVGDWRVLYRPATEQEATRDIAFLVARIINRRDLARIARTLA